MGNFGNEDADSLAKHASEILNINFNSEDTPFSPEPWESQRELHIPKGYLYKQIECYISNKWQEWWDHHPHCRQTKIFFLLISNKHLKELFNLQREDLGRCLRCITGHNFMLRHNNIVNPASFPNTNCRKSHGPNLRNMK